MYPYVKSVHIIFVTTWFAGLFYIVRLFIYNREAVDKPEVERAILQRQYSIMITRLWFVITWPSCILTLLFGTWLVILLGAIPNWLWIKIAFVAGLLLYHFSLQRIYKQQSQNIFKHTSHQLRLWNEVATLFLVAIVMLVVVRSELSWAWGMLGMLSLGIVLTIVAKIYRRLRKN
jgi:protoporphyrinogen IX oxidase